VLIFGVRELAALGYSLVLIFGVRELAALGYSLVLTSSPYFLFTRLPIFDIRPRIFVNNEVVRVLRVVVRLATDVVL
jgi:hypothetical protein